MGFITDLQTWLMFLPSFYSFFLGGSFGTYLSLNFSVRARALSSLLLRRSRHVALLIISYRHYTHGHPLR
jgi:hypothetical protein